MKIRSIGKFKVCKNCGHEKKFHKPSQYYDGNDCHFFIDDNRLNFNYKRCGCKKFEPKEKQDKSK